MARLAIGFALGLATVVGALCLLASGAGAGDEPPPGPKKISHPLAKAVDGTWDIATKSAFGDAKGTTTFSMGIGGTAVLQDYESVGAMGPFAGHGVWKFSEDGKSLEMWWFDVRSVGPVHYRGSLSDTGYDLASEKEKTRITLAKTESGFRFQLYGPDGSLFFTDTYTKR